MDIIATTSTYPLPTADYWGNFVSDLNKRLSEKGLNVLTIAPRCRTLKRVPEDGTETKEFIYFLPRKNQTLGCPPGLIPNTRSLYGLIQLPFYILMFLLKVMIEAIRNRPRLIHASWAVPAGFVSLIVSRLTGIPLVVTVYGAEVYQRGPMNAFIRTVLEHADHVVPCSKHVERLILEFAQPRAMTVVPNSVDVESIHESIKTANESQVRKNLRIPEDSEVVLTARRLVPEKRVRDLVEAAPVVLNEVPNVEFLIIGDGPQLPTLERLAKKLGVDQNVKFLGAVSDEEKFEALSITDICVHTSIQEGLSLALLEFMAADTVVIATSAAGQDEVITHGETGLLYYPSDIDSLANRLIEAIRSEKREQIRDNAFQLVRNSYSTKGQTIRYLSVYKEALESNANPKGGK